MLNPTIFLKEVIYSLEPGTSKGVYLISAFSWI